MLDRLKDPNDFFAYPTYFFREINPTKKLIKTNKIKTNKLKNKTKNENKIS